MTARATTIECGRYRITSRATEYGGEAAAKFAAPRQARLVRFVHKLEADSEAEAVEEMRVWLSGRETGLQKARREDPDLSFPVPCEQDFRDVLEVRPMEDISHELLDMLIAAGERGVTYRDVERRKNWASGATIHMGWLGREVGQFIALAGIPPRGEADKDIRLVDIVARRIPADDAAGESRFMAHPELLRAAR